MSQPSRPPDIPIPMNNNTELNNSIQSSQSSSQFNSFTQQQQHQQQPHSINPPQQQQQQQYHHQQQPHSINPPPPLTQSSRAKYPHRYAHRRTLQPRSIRSKSFDPTNQLSNNTQTTSVHKHRRFNGLDTQESSASINPHVTLYSHGTTTFNSILKAIQHAKVEVLYEAYTFNLDAVGSQVFEELVNAAKRGVFVVFVYDVFGSSELQFSKLEPLIKAGGRVVQFNPIIKPWAWNRSPFFRNHRKSCIVDGLIGFTGGMNTTDEYSSGNEQHGRTFKDFHTRIIGPSALGMRDVFKDTLSEANSPALHEIPSNAQLFDMVLNYNMYKQFLLSAAYARCVKNKGWVEQGWFSEFLSKGWNGVVSRGRGLLATINQLDQDIDDLSASQFLQTKISPFGPMKDVERLSQEATSRFDGAVGTTGVQDDAHIYSLFQQVVKIDQQKKNKIAIGEKKSRLNDGKDDQVEQNNNKKISQLSDSIKNEQKHEKKINVIHDDLTNINLSLKEQHTKSPNNQHHTNISPMNIQSDLDMLKSNDIDNYNDKMKNNNDKNNNTNNNLHNNNNNNNKTKLKTSLKPQTTQTTTSPPTALNTDSISNTIDGETIAPTPTVDELLAVQDIIDEQTRTIKHRNAIKELDMLIDQDRNLLKHMDNMDNMANSNNLIQNNDKLQQKQSIQNTTSNKTHDKTIKSALELFNQIHHQNKPVPDTSKANIGFELDFPQDEEGKTKLLENLKQREYDNITANIPPDRNLIEPPPPAASSSSTTALDTTAQFNEDQQQQSTQQLTSHSRFLRFSRPQSIHFPQYVHALLSKTNTIQQMRQKFIRNNVVMADSVDTDQTPSDNNNTPENAQNKSTNKQQSTNNNQNASNNSKNATKAKNRPRMPSFANLQRATPSLFNFPHRVEQRFQRLQHHLHKISQFLIHPARGTRTKLLQLKRRYLRARAIYKDLLDITNYALPHNNVWNTAQPPTTTLPHSNTPSSSSQSNLTSPLQNTSQLPLQYGSTSYFYGESYQNTDMTSNIELFSAPSPTLPLSQTNQLGITNPNTRKNNNTTSTWGNPVPQQRVLQPDQLHLSSKSLRLIQASLQSLRSSRGLYAERLHQVLNQMYNSVMALKNTSSFTYQVLSMRQAIVESKTQLFGFNPSLVGQPLPDSSLPLPFLESITHLYTDLNNNNNNDNNDNTNNNVNANDNNTNNKNTNGNNGRVIPLSEIPGLGDFKQRNARVRAANNNTTNTILGSDGQVHVAKSTTTAPITKTTPSPTPTVTTVSINDNDKLTGSIKTSTIPDQDMFLHSTTQKAITPLELYDFIQRKYSEIKVEHDTDPKFASHFTNIPAHVLSSNVWTNTTKIQNYYVRAIRSATRSIYITNPYVVPPKWLKRELFKAANRGVQVHLLLSGADANDVPHVRLASLDSYQSYVNHNINIYEYSKRKLHAKVMVVDGLHSCVGSFNLDPYSINVNLETTMVFPHNPNVAQSLIANTLKEIREPTTKHITKSVVDHWPRYWRIWVNWAYLISRIVYGMVRLRPIRVLVSMKRFIFGRRTKAQKRGLNEIDPITGTRYADKNNDSDPINNNDAVPSSSQSHQQKSSLPSWFHEYLTPKSLNNKRFEPTPGVLDPDVDVTPNNDQNDDQTTTTSTPPPPTTTQQQQQNKRAKQQQVNEDAADTSASILNFIIRQIDRVNATMPKFHQAHHYHQSHNNINSNSQSNINHDDHHHHHHHYNINPNDPTTTTPPLLTPLRPRFRLIRPSQNSSQTASSLAQLARVINAHHVLAKLKLWQKSMLLPQGGRIRFMTDKTHMLLRRAQLMDDGTLRLQGNKFPNAISMITMANRLQKNKAKIMNVTKELFPTIVTQSTTFKHHINTKLMQSNSAMVEKLRNLDNMYVYAQLYKLSHRLRNKNNMINQRQSNNNDKVMNKYSSLVRKPYQNPTYIDKDGNTIGSITGNDHGVDQKLNVDGDNDNVLISKRNKFYQTKKVIKNHGVKPTLFAQPIGTSIEHIIYIDPHNDSDQTRSKTSSFSSKQPNKQRQKQPSQTQPLSSSSYQNKNIIKNQARSISSKRTKSKPKGYKAIKKTNLNKSNK